MLDRIRDLAVNGQWQELIEYGSTLLSSDHGLERDDVAWVHLTMAAGYVNTAVGPGEWNQALRHAYEGHRWATPGGMRHTSALMRLSSILVDTGRPRQAKWFAHAYLKAAANHPELAPFGGWPLRNLGIAAMRSGRFGEAVKWYRRSADAFGAAGNDEQATRGRLHLVWAYCMAGKPEGARAVMPEKCPDSLEYFFNSARAVLAAAEGQWSQAVRYVEEALLFQRPGYDYVDAADLCMLASRVARRRGGRVEATRYECRARAFAARQGIDVHGVLVLNTEQKGGEFLDATATLRGSSDLRDGSCFTTGVA